MIIIKKKKTPTHKHKKEKFKIDMQHYTELNT